MARYNHTLLLAAAVLGALLAVQAAELPRSLLQLPGLAGLSAEQLLAVAADTQCTAANQPNADGTQPPAKNACDGCKAYKPCVYAGSTLGWIAGTSQACPSSTPWCNTTDGTCSATAPTGSCNSAQPDSSFTCSSAGYFPNLSSCSKYWICVADSTGALQAYSGDCSAFSNAAYDPRTGLCVPKSQSTCSTVTCKSVGTQVYAPAPWLYVACTNTSVSGALVIACANKDQSYSNGACVNACNQAGRFPWYENNGNTVTDQTSYYECVQNGKSFNSPVKGTCPGGATFNPATSQCGGTGQTGGTTK